MSFFEGKSFHFIGIGGISMSALAKLTLSFGGRVTGSDKVFGETLQALRESANVDFWIGSSPEKIGSPDIVIYSSAVPETDPELSFCRSLDFKVLERSDFLSMLCGYFKTVIGISGTHGKTTACAMLTSVFLSSNLPFTSHFGGDYPPCGNLYVKGNDYFVTEACEYKKNFLKLPCDIAVTLNAEADHPDTFKSLSEVYETFETFLSPSKNKLSIVNGDCALYKTGRLSHAVSFGVDKNSEYRLTDIRKNADNRYCFTLTRFGEKLTEISLSVPGLHNVYNAAAAAVVADRIMIPTEKIKEGLESFSGVKRRFEKVGELNGAEVYSDYAHHPTEIEATIKTARELCEKRLFVIFQPHTYSRTAALITEFCSCFDGVYELYIFKEFAARENENQGLSAFNLYKLLKKEGISYYEETLPLVKKLCRTLRKGDMLVVLSAGDIDNICKLLV